MQLFSALFVSLVILLIYFFSASPLTHHINQLSTKHFIYLLFKYIIVFIIIFIYLCMYLFMPRK